MAFYLRPPTGTLSLSTLEKFITVRLQFLLKVTRCHGNSAALRDVVMDTEFVQMADCLTEGSVKDQISHFLLRLACSGDSGMAEFFMEAESNFFCYRVSCMTQEELLAHVVTPLRKLTKTLNLECSKPLSMEMANVTDILNSMCRHCDLETVVQQFVDGQKSEFITLHFGHVLKLVASRVVVLHRGNAFVPVTRLCEVLDVVFCKLIHHGMKLAKIRYATVVQDFRMARLFAQLKGVYYHRSGSLSRKLFQFGTVCTDDVESLTDYFPLCMSILHRTLRNRHRLAHNDRVQYTLFLKELGMPVHEALHFWRLEYSQSVWRHKAARNQDWASNVRRYTYSIRHLYGLEGSRVNYRGHSCAVLQNRSTGPLECGGCPFATGDSASLLNLLVEDGVPVSKQADIMHYHQPQCACREYLRYKVDTVMRRSMGTVKERTTSEHGGIAPASQPTRLAGAATASLVGSDPVNKVVSDTAENINLGQNAEVSKDSATSNIIKTVHVKMVDLHTSEQFAKFKAGSNPGMKVYLKSPDCCGLKCLCSHNINNSNINEGGLKRKLDPVECNRCESWSRKSIGGNLQEQPELQETHSFEVACNTSDPTMNHTGSAKTHVDRHSAKTDDQVYFSRRQLEVTSLPDHYASSTVLSNWSIHSASSSSIHQGSTENSSPRRCKQSCDLGERVREVSIRNPIDFSMTFNALLQGLST